MQGWATARKIHPRDKANAVDPAGSPVKRLAGPHCWGKWKPYPTPSLRAGYLGRETLQETGAQEATTLPGLARKLEEG